MFFKQNILRMHKLSVAGHVISMKRLMLTTLCERKQSEKINFIFWTLWIYYEPFNYIYISCIVIETLWHLSTQFKTNVQINYILKLKIRLYFNLQNTNNSFPLMLIVIRDVICVMKPYRVIVLNNCKEIYSVFLSINVIVYIKYTLQWNVIIIFSLCNFQRHVKELSKLYSTLIYIVMKILKNIQYTDFILHVQVSNECLWFLFFI